MKSFRHRFSIALALVMLAPLAAAAEDRPSIFKLSHPERAGGRSLSITGEGFGKRRKSVFLSETPLVVYRWSDRTIEIMLPLELPAGEHPLVVARGSLRSDPVSFRLLPRVLRFEADRSKLPVEVTITGTNFGTGGGVRIDGVSTDIVAWYPNVVTAQIPTEMAPAWHNVHLEVNGTSVLAGQFGLPPRVASFGVTEGTVDTQLSFSGDYFGAPGPLRTVVFGDWNNAVTAPVVEWSAHKVTAKLPAGVAPGAQPVWLLIDNIPSERFDFTVIPTIQGLEVSADQDGIALGIIGANLGSPQQSGNVMLGGQPLPVIDWKQDTIAVGLNLTLPAGLHELVVVANGVTSDPALIRVLDSGVLQDGVWQGRYEAPAFEEAW